MMLLSTHVDLNDSAVEAAVRAFLDRDDPASNRVELRGICLVGFDCDHYSGKLTTDALVKAMQADLPGWIQHMSNRINIENLGSTRLEIVCLPMPSVADFRTAFLASIGVT